MFKDNKLIKNSDNRHMQPLPWKLQAAEKGKCITMKSANQKDIMSFWGGDMRYVENFNWCTEQQMLRHAEYVQHAVNHFKFIQDEIARIYNMEDMPEEAIIAIEQLMGLVYLSDDKIPPKVLR